MGWKRRVVCSWTVMWCGSLTSGGAALAADSAPSTDVAPPEAPAPEDREQWFIVELSGQPVGYVHSVQGRREGKLLHAETTHFALERGGQTVTFDTVSEFLETLDHQPISAHLEQSLGSMNVVKDIVFGADGWALTTTQAGTTFTELVPIPSQAWVTPTVAEEITRAALLPGGSEFRYWTLAPDQGLEPMEVHGRVIGEESVEVMGKTVPAYAVDTTSSNLPGMTTHSWLAADATPVRSIVDIGSMKFDMLLADRDLALAQRPAPEIMVSTLVHPSRSISGARSVRTAVYDLRIPAPKTPSASAAGSPAAGSPAARSPSAASADAPATLAERLPSSAVQTVTSRPRGIARVTINLDHPAPLEPPPPLAANLQSSSMLNAADPAILALVAQALEGTPSNATAAEKAEVLRRFVSAYITTTDLSVGFATASEVARTRAGDCTEHGVLLAALLRAANIPSRVASGLVYTDRFVGKSNVFAYHMWTQAWLTDPTDAAGRGAWVNLDAIMSETTPFDGTHILLGTSALNEGAGSNDLVQTSSLIGSLAVKVVRTR